MVWTDIPTLITGDLFDVSHYEAIKDDLEYLLAPNADTVQHNAGARAAALAAREAEAEAAFAARLPPWAMWTADQVDAWIDEHVTDLGSAKPALRAACQSIVIMRDKLWPHLIDAGA